jgi:hypothetical protein
MKKILSWMLMPFVTTLMCVFGGTVTETDTLCGTVEIPSGFKIANAMVKLHAQTSDGKVHLAKRISRILCDSTKTNYNGDFAFHNVDSGDYVLEINHHDSLGAIVSLAVNTSTITYLTVDTSATILRGIDSLKKVSEKILVVLDTLGCMDAKIEPNDSTIPMGAAFYLPEIHRVAQPDSKGRFFISNLPPWNYRLTIASGDSLLKTQPDSVRISITPGDTTHVVSFGSKSGIVNFEGTIIELPGN